MKSQKTPLILGFIFIITGGLALAGQVGYLNSLSITTWMLIFAGASVLFFAAYFISGIRSWGWLFPACIFAGFAGALALDNTSAEEWMPTLAIGSIAIPFVAAFLLDRSRKWALIPAFILGFISFIVPLTNLLGGDAVGTLVLAAIGLPFIVAYLLSADAWWGVIPGGIMLSVALMVALDNVLPDGMAVAVMFLGWMLTFGFVWLRQSRPWAKFPVIVMGVLASIMLLVSLGLVNYWAIGLVVAGLVLIVLSFLPRRTPALK